MHDVLKTRLETFHFIINFQKRSYYFNKKIFIYRSFWVSMTQQKATVCEQLCTHIEITQT